MTGEPGEPGVSWKDYVDVRISAIESAAIAAIHEKDQRDEQRFQAQTRAIDAASLVVDRALVEARQGVADQFRGVVTKLDQLGDTVGVPRQEMDLALASAASNRHAEITDAVGIVVKQFSTDLDRLTKAVEQQGEQFNKAVASQNEQWGVEFNTLNKNVADIQQKQLTRQAQGAGVALTGKTAAAGLSALVALIAIFSFLSRYLLK
jgi:membrane-associated HD superfamily phosphohydrolase